MANVGRTVPNTLGKTPITFAMIEFADPADCNSRKTTWQGYNFQDVTPMYASRSTVPTLDDGEAANGRQMLQQLGSVNADWYMVSGHHGAIYHADVLAFPDDPSTPLNWADQQPFCGFFNESYHGSYWESASSQNPTPTKGDTTNAIYIRTTPAAPQSAATFDQTNPLLDSTHTPPKGIILSACNTLIYKAARTTWANTYSSAVIIGTVAKIVSGTWVTNAIAAAKMTDENFWRDPQSILDQSGMPEQLATQLAQNFPSSSRIGVVYKQTLYFKGKSGMNTQSINDNIKAD